MDKKDSSLTTITTYVLNVKIYLKKNPEKHFQIVSRDVSGKVSSHTQHICND